MCKGQGAPTLWMRLTNTRWGPISKPFLPYIYHSQANPDLFFLLYCFPYYLWMRHASNDTWSMEGTQNIGGAIYIMSLLMRTFIAILFHMAILQGKTFIATDLLRSAECDWMTCMCARVHTYKVEQRVRTSEKGRWLPLDGPNLHLPSIHWWTNITFFIRVLISRSTCMQILLFISIF